MQQSNSAAMRHVVDANAVIVQNAFLDSLGPFSGAFEVIDPDYSVRPQPDGMVRITVHCSIKGNAHPDSTLELTAKQWDCLTVIGFDGLVTSEIPNI